MVELKEVLVWVVGGFCTVITAGVIAHMQIIQRLTRLETKLENQSEERFKKVIEFLHSPTNHLHLDDLINKYHETNELSMEEWEKFKTVCERILDDKEGKYTALERVFAFHAYDHCVHKLKPYRK